MQCKNCGNEFEGNFCNECGQSVKDLNRPFRSVLNDLAGSLFAWDTKFFLSVKHLLFKPGQIASDFAEGKRARYMRPFQLYVFISFLFFLTLTWVTRNETPSDAITFEVDDKEQPLSAITADTTLMNELEKSESDDEKFIAGQISRLMKEPDTFFVTAINIFSWSLFFLMPVFALLLLWFFNKKKYYYATHLIFSINLHSFLFISMLVFILLYTLLGSYIPNILTITFLSLFFVYEFFALHRTYQNRKRWTIIKLLFLNLSYFILLGITGISVIAIAFFTF